MAHIWIVDDSEMSAKILGESLRSKGHNVDIFYCTQETVGSRQPDLIISDYSMPGKMA